MSKINDHGGASGMSRAFFNRILDLVYPDGLYCICCGKIIDSSRPYRLCNECMDEIHWAAGRTCARCGKPLSDRNPSDTCYSCREQEHVFRRGYACAGYGSCERAMIFALKYGARTDIAPTVGEILRDRMALLQHIGAADLSQYDMVIPVPMYEPKRRRRGFNQAELIAREFCRRSGLPLAPRAVARVRDTQAMKGVGQADRSRNIAGAFEVRADVTGKTVLCVDDIFTTGATMDELARTLLEAGAAAVDFLSFAAGTDRLRMGADKEGNALDGQEDSGNWYEMDDKNMEDIYIS